MTSTRSAVAELEKCGYLERERIRNASGQYEDIKYIIREQPQSDEPFFDEPAVKKPVSENPPKANPSPEKSTQLNKDKTNKEKKKIKKKSKTDDINNLSINPREEENNENTRKNDTLDEIDILHCEEKIKENIGYPYLCERYGRERTDEAVELMLGIMYSTKKTIRISGDEYPANYVKSRILKLKFQHIEYVFTNIDKTAAKISNIHSYLKTALFNALSTTGSFYRAEANHDLGDFWNTGGVNCDER